MKHIDHSQPQFSHPAQQLAWNFLYQPELNNYGNLKEWYQDGLTMETLEFGKEFVEAAIGQAIVLLLDSPSALYLLPSAIDYLNRTLAPLNSDLFSYAAVLLKENILAFIPELLDSNNPNVINPQIMLYIVENMEQLPPEHKQLLIRALVIKEDFSNLPKRQHLN